jgi:hypothetical protein
MGVESRICLYVQPQRVQEVASALCAHITLRPGDKELRFFAREQPGSITVFESDKFYGSNASGVWLPMNHETIDILSSIIVGDIVCDNSELSMLLPDDFRTQIQAMSASPDGYDDAITFMTSVITTEGDSRGSAFRAAHIRPYEDERELLIPDVGLELCTYGPLHALTLRPIGRTPGLIVMTDALNSWVRRVAPRLGLVRVEDAADVYDEPRVIWEAGIGP